ncbi:hypothetical protein JCM8202_005385 [Rhodotorula sphaerocarpa]
MARRNAPGEPVAPDVFSSASSAPFGDTLANATTRFSALAPTSFHVPQDLVPRLRGPTVDARAIRAGETPQQAWFAPSSAESPSSRHAERPHFPEAQRAGPSAAASESISFDHDSFQTPTRPRFFFNSLLSPPSSLSRRARSSPRAVQSIWASDASFNPVVGSRNGPNGPRSALDTLQQTTEAISPAFFTPTSSKRAQLGDLGPTVPKLPLEGDLEDASPLRASSAHHALYDPARQLPVHPTPDTEAKQAVAAQQADFDLDGTYGRQSFASADQPAISGNSTPATRYVFIQHGLPNLTEEEFGARIMELCRGLSLRGCFIGHLLSFGHAVLVFHDVRHSLAALRSLSLEGINTAKIFSSPGTTARCISRQAFEQLAGPAHANPLLSASEGVLVFTVRGPTSNRDFTPLPLLASFGDFRTVKSVERHLQVVEFWDDRAAETAKKLLSGAESGGTRFGCSFEPSIASTVAPPWHILAPAVPTTARATNDKSLASLTSSLKKLPTGPNAKPVEAAGCFHQRNAPELLTPSPSPEKARKEPKANTPGKGSPLARTSIQGRLGTACSPPTRGINTRQDRARPRLPAEYGLVRDDKIPLNNMLNFDRIEQGLDIRTTLMIKNIPNKMQDTEVMAYIEEIVGRAFDFFYLRCDYSNGCNVGYGFVNFVTTDALLCFARARLGTRWNKCGSDKLCVLSYANIQGKLSLIQHFKNSSVLDQDESRRPKLFVSTGPRAGEPEPFPACDDPVRKARSAMNASTVGLFPSSKPVFKVAPALGGTQT